jgi:uncharacterized protein YbcC (UPF0753/DUF2309 family)
MSPATQELATDEVTNPALRAAVDRVAHLLPAQGPISVFIHHNLLHAFEGRPFEEAVVEAARIYGAEPFWPAERYRAMFEMGRITDAELRDVIGEELGARAEEPIGGLGARKDVLFVATRYGIREIRGQALEWHLHEDGALRRFRLDLPPAARAAIAATGAGDPEDVARVVGSLWEASVAAVLRSPERDTADGHGTPIHRRHRDLVLDATGIDIDDDVHPLLVRFVSAYLDQGQSLWPMPDREDGLFASFVRTYRRSWMAPLVGPWGRHLVDLLERVGSDALASLHASLDALGVGDDEREGFLLETALALKGWAGMVHQLELRPDRVPVWPVPSRLGDFLAVRLLVERAVLTHVARARGIPASRLDTLRPELAASLAPGRTRRVEERAFGLFQLAQLLGLDAGHLARLGPEELAAIEREMTAHREHQERRWLQASFELHLRRRFLDALTGHRPPEAPPPRLQAVFCVDDREESIRRHLEEVDDRIETLSTAGFFGVAMYHQGARDARPRPLAPVAIRPRHFLPVEMREEGRARGLARDLERLRAQTLHVGSRSLVRGALVSVAGALSLLPLVLHVLSPRRLGGASVRVRATGRLLVDRVEHVKPPIGEAVGYELDEMVAIVEGVLAELGLGTGRFARLVAIVGHAADSLNNPHRSAYDCGACGGSPGGANARAFATMANRAAVRERLARGGLVVPDETWFIAAEHNTTDDSITWFDEEDVPATHSGDLAHARAAFEDARGRNAEERCRRFARSTTSAPTGAAALDAVRARRWDLAEPRPEYNHATNAFCFVGRRERTRGLFLDRRAFLVSYDPTRDDERGSVLRRILEAVVPVVIGINLEYFFGAIDNEVYGAGSKLPHNVASLIGVMNGAHGDLRTGLWSQTVEIHEPVRVTMAIEASPSLLASVVEASPSLSRLVHNRWMFLATLSPETSDVHDFARGEPRLHRPLEPLLVVPGPSSNWFRGKRGHLGLVGIAAEVTS